MKMRVPPALGLLLMFVGCRATSGPPEALGPCSRGPLWYRDGGEKICWSHQSSQDKEKQRKLDDLERRIRELYRGGVLPEGIYKELGALILDPEEVVADRAVQLCYRYRLATLLPQLQQAHLRWPKNGQIERIFAKTAANCWSDQELRKYFWALPADTPRNGELYRTLHCEMARCGTEEDARRLQEQLPQGSDWRHDPVIARIRLHRNRWPDRLAYEILRFLDERPPEGLDTWPVHLYRCELLRYLTFGDDLHYRSYIQSHFQRTTRIFCSDQETYPHQLEDILNAWLKEHPL